MMTPSEAQKLAAMGPKGVPANNDAPASDETPAPSASGAAIIQEKQKAASPDPVYQPPEDVPMPAILSDFGKTEGNMPTSATSEYVSGELAAKAVSDEDVVGPAADSPSIHSDTTPTWEPTEEVSMPSAPDASAEQSSQMNAEPPDVAESGPTVESLDEARVDEPLPEPVAKAFEPVSDPPVPELLRTPEQTAGGVTGSEEQKPGAEAAGLPDEAGPVGEDTVGPPEALPAVPQGIEKPADDLSPFDSYQSPAMYDSVRIMEPRSADKADDIETRLQPGSSGRFDAAAKSTDEPIGQEPYRDDAPIPPTSHNIGLVDTDGKKSSKLKPLAEGTILNGRYEIIRKIGGGGMGAVYLASDNNLGGVLRAVKEMVQTHIEEEQQEKAINDFKRESMILSSLDHVSIPTIYDYFYDDSESRFYLVMKYISGGDLSSRLRSAQEGKVDEKSVCEWAVQIIDVLDYLHNQPSTIVYRDLKPSNIMIDGNSGRAMLIDFGIARSISQREEKGVTAVGTMGYAPPELFSGNVEPRSDIYSLGSTMFHLLTGADPQSNPLLIFDFQKNPRPRQINPQLSDQIERIIMKAVQYNADERFRSAAEMRDVLEDHILKLKAGIVTYGVGEVPASVSLANQSVFCGFCGQRIVATDMFCAFCGAKQPIAQQGVHAEIYTQAAWTAKLVIEGTSELTAPAFSLQKDDNLLGRRDPMSNIFPEVDLSKYDPQTKISRRHARIWREGNNFLVEDLGSSNGTILSRSTAETFRLAPKQPQVLSAGDRIRLGDATLHFIIG